MRRAAKIDANQREIVARLREMNCSVQSLAAVGQGVPDLLVGIAGAGNFLVEVKDGSKPPSRQQLTPDQRRWHDAWRGPVSVLHSVDEAEAWVNGIRGRL